MKQSANLIRYLLADSKKFNEQGMAYTLLQEYFHGLSLETIRPLLAHDDIYVRRSVAFIVSELGIKAEPLIHDIVPLIQNSDRHTRWYAVESVMVCTGGKHADLFVNVVRELEDKDDAILELAMRLISNASVLQLEAALSKSYLLGASAKIHEQGLSELLNARAENIHSMLDDLNPLTKRYGAIGAKRLFSSFPKLLEHAATSSDTNVRRFSVETLEAK